METITEILKKPVVRRLLILVAIGIILYIMRSLITLFLLTFIFIYLINAAQKFIYRHIHRIFPVKRTFIIVFIYLIAIALLVLLIWVYLPQIVEQTVDVTKRITSSATALLSQKTTGNDFWDSVLNQVRNIDLKSYVQSGGKAVLSLIGNIGALGLYFFLAIILSMFFMLQKGRIYAFIGSFGSSKVSWLYNELKFFGLKFTNTFGKVLQTQILISFINCILSMIMLGIMQFPSVLGLGVMIFMFGIVPVAGVFISLIPLSIIAYTVGGFQSILYVLIMVVILHALESYVLNPKLMSDKTNLPVFFTFLVLTVSSHFFGVWGLLVGIPVFIFVLDILDVKVTDIKHPLPRAAARLGSKLKKGVTSTRTKKPQ